MVGYADLDEYGSWQQYPEYGAVWFPTGVARDWAPYRNGYWTTVGNYGPTWVDYAPWGYAPFHYGRWAYIGGRWGWCPGAYVARPYWAPALVGWCGGSRWGVSLSAGGPVYGWVPLGWGEPYRPSWNNCGSRCWNNYNKPYAVNAAERPTAPPTRYANWNVPGAATAVSGATFTGRKPVYNNQVTVNTAAVTSAPILATAPAVAMPKPGQIPGVRPGERGTPPPASQFYPTSKPTPLPPAGGSGPGVAVGGAVRPVPGAAPTAPVVQPSPTMARPAPTAVPPPSTYAPAAPAAPYVVPSAGSNAAPPASGRPAPQANVGTPAPNTYVAPPANVKPVPQSAPPAQYQNQNQRNVAPPQARQEYRPVPQAAPVPQPSSGPAFPSSGANRAGPAVQVAPAQPAAPAVAPVPRAAPAPWRCLRQHQHRRRSRRKPTPAASVRRGKRLRRRSVSVTPTRAPKAKRREDLPAFSLTRADWR